MRVPAVVAVEHQRRRTGRRSTSLLGRREHQVGEADRAGSGRAARVSRDQRLEVRARASGVSDSGSLAMLHSTTQGWFLSRATSSRIAWRWTACVASLIGLGGEGRRRPGRRRSAADADVEPDGGGLVDDDDAVPVGVVEDLLGVGVVRGAERVRADPLHQREVVDHERVVVALAAHRAVLVLAEAGEVERLAVDQEPRAVDLDRADADRQRVRVDELVAAEQLDVERRTGSPRRAATGARPRRVSVARRAGRRARPRRRRRRAARRAPPRRPRPPTSVGDDARPRRRGRSTTVTSLTCDARRRVQPDRAVQAGVVEEVVEVALARRPSGVSSTMPGGIDCQRQLVVRRRR